MKKIVNWFFGKSKVPRKNDKTNILKNGVNITYAEMREGIIRQVSAIFQEKGGGLESCNNGARLLMEGFEKQDPHWYKKVEGPDDLFEILSIFSEGMQDFHDKGLLV